MVDRQDKRTTEGNSDKPVLRWINYWTFPITELRTRMPLRK